jgi:hypothetical protein
MNHNDEPTIFQIFLWVLAILSVPLSFILIGYGLMEIYS